MVSFDLSLFSQICALFFHRIRIRRTVYFHFIYRTSIQRYALNWKRTYKPSLWRPLPKQNRYDWMCRREYVAQKIRLVILVQAVAHCLLRPTDLYPNRKVPPVPCNFPTNNPVQWAYHISAYFSLCHSRISKIDDFQRVARSGKIACTRHRPAYATLW